MEDTPRPLTDHLEELRRRCIRGILAVAAGTVLSYFFVDSIFLFLAKPIGSFVFLRPTDAFFARLKIALSTGIIIAMPVLLLQIWKFIVVALKPLERKSHFWILPTSYILFILGFSFGFFLLVPLGVKFLLSYSSSVLHPLISIDEYIDFIGVLCIALGALFQSPLVTFFIARFGFLQAKTLSKKRRIALLVIYVASAIVTPGPDPVTSFLLACSSYLLYEFSIWTATWGERKYSLD